MSGTMTVAELVARLRADTSQFGQGMRGAERDLRHFDKQVGTSMAGLRRLGQTFDQVMSGISIATATAVTSLAAVGVAYNTLMQKTTSSFKVLLGSASAANDMIGELMDFATKSPFPRQLFIQGAQQLIGFGLEARKVVPAFEAIEDAAAAVGGGAEEIQQFTSIFAQIKSLGRANTEVLMRFGTAGIDAFKLLADQAGVSVSEMRKRVTEGALGADDAIDMMTKGLTEKFEGAAAGVKETWIGAKDRIAAAWRDIGSKLMAPFVDPQGGGAAVVWANQLADLLRRIEAKVPPLVTRFNQWLDSITKITDKVNFDVWIERMSQLVDEHRDSIKTLLPVVVALGAAFAHQGLAMLPLIGGMANFIPMPGKLVMALGALILSSEDGRKALFGLGEALQEGIQDMLPVIIPAVLDLVRRFTELLPVLTDITLIVAEVGFPLLAEGLTLTATALTALLTVIKPVAEFLADHPSLVHAIAAAYAGWKIMTIVGHVGKLTTGLRSLAVAQGLVAGTAAISTATTSTAVSAASIATINSNLASIGTRVGLLSRVGPLLAAAFSPATLAIGATTFALFQATSAANKAKEAAQGLVDSLTEDMNTTSIDSMKRAMADLGDEIERVNNGGQVDGNDNLMQQGANALSKASWIPGASGVASIYNHFSGGSNKAENEFVERATRELEALERQTAQAEAAMARFASEAGVTDAVAERLASTLGIDMTSGADAITKGLRKGWEEAREAGTQIEIMAAAAGMSVTAFQRQQRVISDNIGVMGRLVDGAAMMANLGNASERMSQRTIAAFKSSANAIMGLYEAYAETIAAIDGMVKSFLNPLSVWEETQQKVTAATQRGAGAAKEAAKIQEDLAKKQRDTEKAQRDLADAQYNAVRAANAVEEAQRGVAEVMERQFDATKSAQTALNDLVAAQAGAVDPMLNMLQALESQADVSGKNQTIEVTEEGHAVMVGPERGSVLELVEANMAVERAAIMLAGALQSGDVSMGGLMNQIDRWVSTGVINAEEAAELIKMMEDAVANTGPKSLTGIEVKDAISKQTSADKAIFDDKFAQDLEAAQQRVTEAVRASEDAVYAVEEAARRVQEVQAAVAQGSLDMGSSIGGGLAETEITFSQFLDGMQEKLNELVQWQKNLRTIAERGGAELAIEIAKWGPQAADKVALIANSTAPEFDRFVNLMEESMAASTEAMILEFGLQQIIAEGGGAATASALAEALGIMPEDMRTIAKETGADFGQFMLELALIAEEGGKMSAQNLAWNLANELGVGYEGVYNNVLAYMDLFEALGIVITNTANSARQFAPGTLVDPYSGRNRPNRIPIANGAIFEAFANGGFGENHIAQIAKAGDMRLWAEPETGGEAYIPLAMAKRARSMTILAEVARRFGMALQPMGLEHLANGGFADSGVIGAMSARAGGGGRGGDHYEINVELHGSATEEDGEKLVKALVKWQRSNGAVPIRTADR